jgi:hypothetical protein
MTTKRSDKPTDEREDPTITASDQRRAIKDTAGALTGVYPPGYLEELRADWPD